MEAKSTSTSCLHHVTRGASLFSVKQIHRGPGRNLRVEPGGWHSAVAYRFLRSNENKTIIDDVTAMNMDEQNYSHSSTAHGSVNGQEKWFDKSISPLLASFRLFCHLSVGFRMNKGRWAGFRLGAEGSAEEKVSHGGRWI